MTNLFILSAINLLVGLIYLCINVLYAIGLWRKQR